MVKANRISVVLALAGLLGCTSPTASRSCSLPVRKASATAGTPVIAIRAAVQGLCDGGQVRTAIPVPSTGGTATWTFDVACSGGARQTVALALTAEPSEGGFKLAVSNGSQSRSVVVAPEQLFSATVGDLSVDVSAQNDVLE
jgi:hypothetical protein